jgi:hypothetical protein
MALRCGKAADMRRSSGGAATPPLPVASAPFSAIFSVAAW